MERKIFCYYFYHGDNLVCVHINSNGFLINSQINLMFLCRYTAYNPSPPTPTNSPPAPSGNHNGHLFVQNGANNKMINYFGQSPESPIKFNSSVKPLFRDRQSKLLIFLSKSNYNILCRVF